MSTDPRWGLVNLIVETLHSRNVEKKKISRGPIRYKLVPTLGHRLYQRFREDLVFEILYLLKGMFFVTRPMVPWDYFVDVNEHIPVIFNNF